MADGDSLLPHRSSPAHHSGPHRTYAHSPGLGLFGARGRIELEFTFRDSGVDRYVSHNDGYFHLRRFIWTKRPVD
jgi:hypothetical protein